MIDIHLPSTPRHLKITPTMVDDFLMDPCLGAYVLMGVKLDVFQSCLLKILWWTPNVIVSNGFGTGKSSMGAWLFFNLRALIIGDQHLCAYFQTFQAGKDIFWPYYHTFDSRRAPIFNAQLGKLDEEGDTDGKDNTKGPACYKQYFKNDSLIMMPAPNWMQDAKGQAGQTFNGVWVDEWTKVETMTKATTKVVNEAGEGVGGINQQIIGRVRRKSWNQHHPLWANRRCYSATAETLNHPAYRRVRTFKRMIAKGDPNYAMFTACFKDFSNIPTEVDIRVDNVETVVQTPAGPVKKVERQLVSRIEKPFKEFIPDWATIRDMKENFTKGHFLREVLGIWARETLGWYSEENLNKLAKRGLEPMPLPSGGTCDQTVSGLNGAYYFLGIDPAPAQSKRADDGAMAILRARPRADLNRKPTNVPRDWLLEFVWAAAVRGEKRREMGAGIIFAPTAGAWSGKIHQLNALYALAGILSDSQGGGQWLVGELNKSIQDIDGVQTTVTPIAQADDPVGDASYILNLFRRRDNGVSQLWPLLAGDDGLYEAMHVKFQEAVEQVLVAFPVAFDQRTSESMAGWTEERKFALIALDRARSQLMNVQVAMRESGGYDLTRNGNKTFFCKGKKDLAYACIFAYIRFLIWLQTGDWEEEESGDEGIYLA